MRDLVQGPSPEISLYRYSLVVCARWETAYITEWLNYYRSIGYDHVFLYCNDDDPKSLYETVLPFTQGPNPYVTFHFFPLQGQQHLMYMHFLRNHKHQTEWFSFLDVDEFLHLPNHRTIDDFVTRFPGTPDAIHFNWCFFGNNGFETRPEGSVLLNYTKRHGGFYNRMTKHITRAAAIDPDLIHRGFVTDFWHYWNGIANFRDLTLVNVAGDDMHAYYDDPATTDAYLAEAGRFELFMNRAIVFHYVYKSREDFLIRARRGTSSVFAQQAWYETAHQTGEADKILVQLNQVEDTTLADYWRAHLAKADATNVFAPPVGQLLSRGRMALQSSCCADSRQQSISQDAAGAVDGVIDGDYSFHTATEPSPWWLVDLGERHEITEIRLFNRIDRREFAARANRLKIEINIPEQPWTEVVRKEDDHIFGGADGNPLIWRPQTPISARYVRITLLTHNPLHLDQVQIFGTEIPGLHYRPEEERRRDAPPASLEEREILQQFQSIGNNCEFGLIQKSAGVGGLGLLRWTAAAPHNLVAGLLDDFREMGEPHNVELHDHNGEYFYNDLKYGFQSHTFIKVEDAEPQKFLLDLADRTRFLRRKMIEDLEEGDVVWLYNSYKEGPPPNDDAVRRVAELLAERGPNLLFWTVPAVYENRTPGTVEQLSDNLIKGYVDLFTSFDNQPLNARQSWIGVCKSAIEKVNELKGNLSSQAPPHQIFVPGVSDSALFSRFQSLGNNCEYGVVARTAGIERLQLFQWCRTTPAQLATIFDNRFHGFDEPENILLDDHLGEYFIRNGRYGVDGHSFVKIGSIDEAKFHRDQISRIRYLTKKLIEDLEDGTDIFLYNADRTSPGPMEHVLALAHAIRNYGPAYLLVVLPAKLFDREANDVEWRGENLLVAYKDEFNTFEHQPERYMPGWRTICLKSLDMIAARNADAVVPASRSDSTMEPSPNIAKGKPATQSSTSPWSRHPSLDQDAAGAVTGRITGEAKFHTDLDEVPWWQVDLQTACGIGEIRIFNRLDDINVINRASRLAIDIGAHPDRLIEIYRRETDTPFGGIDGNPLIFKPPIPIPGRFVRIRLLTRNYLHLDQVEVYGEPLPIPLNPTTAPATTAPN